MIEIIDAFQDYIATLFADALKVIVYTIMGFMVFTAGAGAIALIYIIVCGFEKRRKKNGRV